MPIEPCFLTFVNVKFHVNLNLQNFEMNILFMNQLRIKVLYFQAAW